MAARAADGGKAGRIDTQPPVAAVVDATDERIKLEISPPGGSEVSVSMDAEKFQQLLAQLMYCALQLGVPWPNPPK